MQTVWSLNADIVETFQSTRVGTLSLKEAINKSFVARLDRADYSKSQDGTVGYVAENDPPS